MNYSGVKNSIKSNVTKLKNTGFNYIFLSSVANKMISLLSSVLLVRILTKADYGVFAYAYNIIGLFMLATGFGAASGVLQLCSEDRTKEEKIDIFRFGCKYGMGVNFIMGLVILSVAIFVPLPIKGANVCLALMSFLPMAQLFFDLQSTYLRVELKNKEYAITNTMSTILILVFGCMLSLLFREKGLIIAYYISSAATAIFACIAYKAPVSLKKLNISKASLKEFFRISGISMVNNGLSHLLYLLDVFIIGIVIANETVIADYKIATTIPTALLFIPSTIVIYIYPYFAKNKGNRDWLEKNYRKVTYVLGLVNLSISLVLIALAPFIISFIFGKQYLAAVPVFRILCANFVVSGTFRVLAGNVLVTQGKLEFNLFESICSSLVNTVLNVIMITRWGSLGAAIATLVTVVFSSVLSTGYLLYVFKHGSTNNE